MKTVFKRLLLILFLVPIYTPLWINSFHTKSILWMVWGLIATWIAGLFVSTVIEKWIDKVIDGEPSKP